MEVTGGVNSVAGPDEGPYTGWLGRKGTGNAVRCEVATFLGVDAPCTADQKTFDGVSDTNLLPSPLAAR